jgi:cysteine synthase A
MPCPLLSNVTQAIGHTPMVQLQRIGAAQPGAILLKLEASQPGGSVKDRVGLHLVEAAEAQGLIHPQRSVLIEPTSGNSGIALAMVAAVKGYKLIIVMPENCSMERRVVLAAYGAQVVLTPAAAGMEGACTKATELAKTIANAYMLDQFNNHANVAVHEATTGPEIWEATGGQLDAFVACVGTGGTLSGVARFLKRQNPAIAIVAVEPMESAILSGCAAGSHGIQGVGTGFVPGILAKELINQVIAVSTEEAMAMAVRLAKEEGLLSGISSGANVVACLQLLAQPAFAGKRVATLQCSTGERYLTSPLFAPLWQQAQQWPVTPV